jgi:hypothetical protein
MELQNIGIMEFHHSKNPVYKNNQQLKIKVI